MTEPVRSKPSFDDPNPTLSDPVHPHVDGFSGPEPEAESAPATDARLSALEEEVGALTAQVGTQRLFDLTQRRVNILLSTLIKLGESGDFALWLPLAVIDEQVRTLDWTSVPPVAVARFYQLVATTLTTYATRLSEHAMAVLKATQEEAPLPAPPTWTAEDTEAMYQMSDDLFAAETPAPDAAPIEEAAGE